MRKLFEFTRRTASKRNQESNNNNSNNINNNETRLGDPLLRSDFLSPPGITGLGSRDGEAGFLSNGGSAADGAAGAGAATMNATASSNSSGRRDRHRRLSYKLMKWMGNLLAITSCLSFLIAVPMVAYHAMVIDKARPDFTALASAGAFVLITLIMSFKLIYNHLTHWYMPDVQKYVVRILWMVPLYAIQSWLSLRFRNARIYIDTLRDLYEAYVIQSFLYFLMELLGGEDTLVQILQAKNSQYGIHFGLLKFFIPPWEMGFEFVSIISCHDGIHVQRWLFLHLFNRSIVQLFNRSFIPYTISISITSSDGKLQIWRAAICSHQKPCIPSNSNHGTFRPQRRRRIQFQKGIRIFRIHNQLVSNVGTLLPRQILSCHP